jgi:SAM-dependent methyltransferase
MQDSVDDALLRGYNDVPYTSAPDPARHPERLATLGTLLGLDVAPVASCRVLELACGDGANLVPIASTLPGATFVGFDFAAAPIARAQRMVRELGLANVSVLQLDLREVPADFGTFDYIIAHGLYSWIPADVRAHVMPLIARHLAPDGVALVSYNAMPGCHLRGIVWDMLKYHTRNIPLKSAKVAAARGFLELVATPVGGDTPTEQAMRAEVRSAAQGSEASLAHDELGDPNNAFYFHEFSDDAVRAGLTFLAEARLDTMLGEGLAPQVRQALGRLDRLAREQYLDFVHFRHFRESLLCHANAPTRFVLQPARVLGLQAVPSSAVRREAATRTAAQSPATTADPLEQWLLSLWPRSASVMELREWRDRQTPAAAGAGASSAIEQQVAELYATGRVDLRTMPVTVAVVAGERPEAFAAARWLNREREIIPSLYHEALRYQDPLGRRLLALLDGTRTRDDLCAALGGPFAGPAGRGRLDAALKILASKALLVR